MPLSKTFTSCADLNLSQLLKCPCFTTTTLTIWTYFSRETDAAEYSVLSFSPDPIRDFNIGYFFYLYLIFFRLLCLHFLLHLHFPSLHIFFTLPLLSSPQIPFLSPLPLNVVLFILLLSLLPPHPCVSLPLSHIVRHVR